MQVTDCKNMDGVQTGSRIVEGLTLGRVKSFKISDILLCVLCWILLRGFICKNGPKKTLLDIC